MIKLMDKKIKPFLLCFSYVHVCNILCFFFVSFSFLTSSRALGAKGFRITWTEIHEAGNIINHFSGQWNYE